jgi:hypothetical protein
MRIERSGNTSQVDPAAPLRWFPRAFKNLGRGVF